MCKTYSKFLKHNSFILKSSRLAILSSSERRHDVTTFCLRKCRLFNAEVASLNSDLKKENKFCNDGDKPLSFEANF